MALEDALDEVHKAEYRLERQQQLEEEQQAHELLLKEQNWANARMSKQVWSSVSQLCSDSMLHETCLAIAGQEKSR